MIAADAPGSDESSHPVGPGVPAVAVELWVPSSAAEVAADRLWQLGASAVSESTAPDGGVPLVGDVDPAAAEQVAHDLGGRSRVLEAQDSWTTGWHAGATAWPCGDRLLVRPHWLEVDPEMARGRVQVVLDPGTAFGAGSHPSTRAALVALEQRSAGASSVLDVGCGTGVLGLAALALGAGRLVAIDIDPEAVTATRRAAVHNGLEQRCDVDDTELASVPGTFDLVLANLLVPVLEQLGAELARRVAPGGALVLSGVLADQLDRAVRAVAPLVLVDRHDLDGWSAAVMTHPAGV